MKKFVSVLVILAMFASLIPLAAFSAFAEDESNSTPIATWDELKAVANTDGKYVLSADLDLGGATITESISLIGELDGAGHSITNFKLENSSLFAQGGALTIKNLTVGAADTRIVATYTAGPAGVLLAQNDGVNALTFENVDVYVNASIANANFGIFVGLLAGGAVSFQECLTGGVVITTVVDNTVMKGGFVGRAERGVALEFDTCVNTADITLIEGDEMAGGFVGYLDGDASKTDVLNSINFGAVVAKHCSGGCIGYIYMGTLEINGFCNYGDIPGFTDSNQAGGVVGRVNETVKSVKIQNAVNFGDVKAGNANSFSSGIIGRCKATATQAVVTNCVNAGEVRACDLVRTANNDYTVNSDANCYYIATSSALNHNGATELADMDAVIAKLNSDGFMTDFRSVWGDFEIVSDDEGGDDEEDDNVTLLPNRVFTAQDALPFEDTPFTEYVAGYVLHHMDFSKVESFDATKYFVTNDAEPITFELKDGELHVVAGDSKLYMVLANNGLPQNIADFTVEFEFRIVNFVDTASSQYLCFVPSVTIDPETGKLVTASKDCNVRPNLIANFEEPLFDGWAYAYSSTGDELETEKAEVSTTWKGIIEEMKAGEAAKFSISIEGPTRTINRITVSQGEESVNFIRNEDMFDFGGFITFMFRNVDLAISEITIIAGNVNEYDTLIWPGEENALVQSVSADVVKQTSSGDNTGNNDTDNDDTGNNNPSNDNTDNSNNGNNNTGDNSTDDQTTTAPEKNTTASDNTEEGGCASSVFGTMTVLLITLGTTTLLCKKKKD